MYSVEKGEVKRLLSKREERETLIVMMEGGEEERAINYVSFTGSVEEGDLLLLNTTALRLGLGSGGFHMVIMNLSSPQRKLEGPGHIMKLRYTPLQMKVHSIEEERPDLFSFSSLEGLPVIVTSLHSHLLPLVLSLLEKGGEDLPITYIMVGGGSLPLSFSDTVEELRERDYIKSTITSGETYGGDFEAINIYTALLTAKKVCQAKVALISMGVGHVGTNCQLGFSGVEMAGILQAISTLGGEVFYVPRLSFVDRRRRHRGLSHHTMTLLDKLTSSRATVILPALKGEKGLYLQEMLMETDILERHRVIFIPKEDIQPLMEKYGVTFTTMGRGVEEDPEFFQAPILTGYYVGDGLQGRKR